MRTVIVRYQLDPTRREEHMALLGKVFEELAAAQPAGLRYTVSHGPDGLSFTHVARIDTADGSNPLTSIAAFKAFSKDVGSRCTVAPQTTEVTVVGDYGQ